MAADVHRYRVYPDGAVIHQDEWEAYDNGHLPNPPPDDYEVKEVPDRFLEGIEADAVAEYVKAYPRNENCLEGFHCPRCGGEDRFRVAMTADIELFDDGTGDHGDTDWDASSYCECLACHHAGVVADFTGQSHPESFKVHMLWGEYTTRRYDELAEVIRALRGVGLEEGQDPAEAARAILDQLDIDIAEMHYGTYEFDTEAEAKAFVAGVNMADGWAEMQGLDDEEFADFKKVVDFITAERST